MFKMCKFLQCVFRKMDMYWERNKIHKETHKTENQTKRWKLAQEKKTLHEPGPRNPYWESPSRVLLLHTAGEKDIVKMTCFSQKKKGKNDMPLKIKLPCSFFFTTLLPLYSFVIGLTSLSSRGRSSEGALSNHSLQKRTSSNPS